MKKVLNWLEENKNELMFGWSLLVTGIAVLGIFCSLLFMTIADDLAEVVEIKEAEKYQLEQERNYYYYLYNDVIQTYEDSIPKQQYIDDIEYLESVILELRDQHETYNNKEN